MQTNHKLFDDLAKVAGGTMEAMAGLRQEIETVVRTQMEKFLKPLHTVTREEFDAIKAMAAKARDEQEKLALRVKHLEQQLVSLLNERSAALARQTGPDGGPAPDNPL